MKPIKLPSVGGAPKVHTTDGKDFDVSEARTRANLGLVDDYGSNPNVRLVLSDGNSCVANCPSGQFTNGTSCGTVRPGYAGTQASCTNMGGTYTASKCFVNIGTDYTATSK